MNTRREYAAKVAEANYTEFIDSLEQVNRDSAEAVLRSVYEKGGLMGLVEWVHMLGWHSGFIFGGYRVPINAKKKGGG